MNTEEKTPLSPVLICHDAVRLLYLNRHHVIQRKRITFFIKHRAGVNPLLGNEIPLFSVRKHSFIKDRNNLCCCYSFRIRTDRIVNLLWFKFLLKLKMKALLALMCLDGTSDDLLFHNLSPVLIISRFPPPYRSFRISP